MDQDDQSSCLLAGEREKSGTVEQLRSFQGLAGASIT